MISWFRAHAPIRRKFDIMTVTSLGLVAVPVVTTWLAISMDQPPASLAYIAIFALVISLITSRIFKKSVCDPYVGTVVRMEALAEGDFESPIAHTEFTDCVGRMTKAMSVFRQSGISVHEAGRTQQRVVTSLGEGLSKLSDGDLCYRIEEPFPADYESLRTEFNRASEALNEVIAAVVDTAKGITNGAADIRQASDDLSQRTEQQAASLEQTAAAMDEITGTVRETASGASEANVIVGQTRDEAHASGDVVRRAVESMHGIENASREIGDIISVIDGIAFQTNLLALNAGVEAARAGDAGKGFAVVASEVRALAQRSADAAKDVKAKITASTDQVEQGVQLVNQTGEALERIITRISEIAVLMNTISESAKQQATGLQQVNTAVSEMDGVTQPNAAMVEEATAAARSLAEEAHQLSRRVANVTVVSKTGSPRLGNAVHALQAMAANSGTSFPVSKAKRIVANSGSSEALYDDWSAF